MENTQVAIVTGGTAGIGKEVCLLLAAKGIRVVIAGRNKERGNQLAEQIAQQGAKALFVSTDVGQESQVKQLVDTVLGAYGRIDFGVAIEK